MAVRPKVYPRKTLAASPELQSNGLSERPSGMLEHLRNPVTTYCRRVIRHIGAGVCVALSLSAQRPIVQSEGCNGCVDQGVARCRESDVRAAAGEQPACRRGKETNSVESISGRGTCGTCRGQHLECGRCAGQWFAGDRFRPARCRARPSPDPRGTRRRGRGIPARKSAGSS
jgi:hypothetical protein